MFNNKRDQERQCRSVEETNKKKEPDKSSLEKSLRDSLGMLMGTRQSYIESLVTMRSNGILNFYFWESSITS